MIKYFVFLFVCLSLVGCDTENSTTATINERDVVHSEEDKSNILFIGNSYTYGNNGVDQGVANLVNDEDSFSFAMAAQSKYHLNLHWDDEATLSLFNSKKWDKVILQEYSSGPIKQYEEFLEFTKKWKQRILKANPSTEIFLFDTWGYKKAKSMPDSLYAAYSRVGEQLDIQVVPVGLFWKKHKEHLNFYEEDNAHPNAYGTFATACVFYEFLFDEDIMETQFLSKSLDHKHQKNIKRWAREFSQEFKE